MTEKKRSGFTSSHKARASAVVRKIACQNNLKPSGKTVRIFKQLISVGIIEWPNPDRTGMWEWFETVKHNHPSKKQRARTPGKCFYKSKEWRELRYKVLKRDGRRCVCCGANPDDGVTVLHVDHIKPKSSHPELSLAADNLQVLCEDCNLGKSNYDTIDYRLTNVKMQLEQKRQEDTALAEEALLAYELKRRLN